MEKIISPAIFDTNCPFKHRVRTGHGKPGKSWNLSISVSRPRRAWKVMENYSICGT